MSLHKDEDEARMLRPQMNYLAPAVDRRQLRKDQIVYSTTEKDIAEEEGREGLAASLVALRLWCRTGKRSYVRALKAAVDQFMRTGGQP